MYQLKRSSIPASLLHANKSLHVYELLSDDNSVRVAHVVLNAFDLENNTQSMVSRRSPTSCFPLLQLIILEVAGVLKPENSALAWRVCLVLMVVSLHIVLPFLLAFAWLGEIGFGRYFLLSSRRRRREYQRRYGKRITAGRM